MSRAGKIVTIISGNRFAQKFYECVNRKTAELMGIGSGGDVCSSGEMAVVDRMLKLLPAPYCIFDVGANTGQFLNLVMSKMAAGEYSIHCFEPSPQAFAELSRGKRANNASVILNPVGLGKEVGEVILYYNEPGSQIASLTKRRLDHLGVDFSQSQTVRIDTLDHYCEVNGVRRIDLMKVDVEGHELDVLQAGGHRMFEAGAVKLVIFEFGGCNIDTRTFFQDFFYFFKNVRMELFRITPSGYLYPITQYKEIFEQFRTTNFLAVHGSLSKLEILQ